MAKGGPHYGRLVDGLLRILAQGDQDIQRAIDADAQGYLLKGLSGEVLVNAIRSVDAGLKVLPPPRFSDRSPTGPRTLS